MIFVLTANIYAEQNSESILMLDSLKTGAYCDVYVSNSTYITDGRFTIHYDHNMLECVGVYEYGWSEEDFLLYDYSENTPGDIIIAFITIDGIPAGNSFLRLSFKSKIPCPNTVISVNDDDGYITGVEGDVSDSVEVGFLPDIRIEYDNSENNILVYSDMGYENLRCYVSAGTSPNSISQIYAETINLDPNDPAAVDISGMDLSDISQLNVFIWNDNMIPFTEKEVIYTVPAR